MILWSDRKSLFVMSWMVSGLLLMRQSRVFQSMCVCMFMCWYRSCISKISCKLVVSGCSGLFQGILKSPKMMILLELLNRGEMLSGNYSKKVSIVTGCFIEYDGMQMAERRYDLVVMFRLIVSDSNDVYSLKDNFLTCRCDLCITAIPPPFLFPLLWMNMLYSAVPRLAFIYWYSDSFPCCVQVSVTKHISILLSCIWCMSISNLGFRDCMFIYAMLSLVEFQKVLLDLFSGHNKF